MSRSSDVDLLRHGARRERISARLTENEYRRLEALREHTGTDASTWFRWALMSLIYEQLPEPGALGAVRQGLLAFKDNSKVLGPTLHVIHVRYPTPIKLKVDELLAQLPGVRPGTFLRWVLAKYAPMAMALPSKAARDADYDVLNRQLSELTKAAPPVIIEALP